MYCDDSAVRSVVTAIHYFIFIKSSFNYRYTLNMVCCIIKVLGGNGYTAEYQVERLWRDSKLIEIGGGTNEAHHKNIVRDIKKMNSKIG